MRRYVRSHEGNPRRGAALSDMSEEGRPFLREVEKVRLAHPARHSPKLELRVRCPLDRIDAHTLLPCVAPFFLHVAGLDGCRGHHQDQELYRIDRFRDLFPPADTAFEEITVLSDERCRGLRE